MLAARTGSEIEAVASEVEGIGTDALPVPTDTKMRRDYHRDDLAKLAQPEDVADLTILAVTQSPKSRNLSLIVD